MQLRCPDEAPRDCEGEGGAFQERHAWTTTLLTAASRQGGKSSRAELGGSGLTPIKATRARSAEEDPDEAVIAPDGEPPVDPNQRKSEVRGFVFFVVHGPSPGF